MTYSLTAVITTALAFGSVVYAQTAQTCSNNVCFSLNIPEATASSGSGDVYMQITAPTTFTWVALGQGSQMSGANMFVLYTDASGSNVTLSPRLGTGHAEPKYNSAAQITILDGTGVSDDTMTVNFRCSSCISWSGGSMDFTKSSGAFISAVKSGSSLGSDSTSAGISQHDSHNQFSFDFSKATGGDSLNPFTTSASTTSGSATGSSSATTSRSSTSATAKTTATTCSATTTETSTIASPSGSGCPTSWPSSWSTSWPSSAPSEYASCYSEYGHGSWPTSAPYIKVKRASDDSCTTDSSSSDSSSSSSNSNGAFGFSGDDIPFGGDYKKAQTVMIAHGVMASLAFVILFPIGAISIRLLSFPGLLWFHGIVQVLAYLIFIAAFGLGIYLAQNIHALNDAHPIIGIVLFILLFFQPFLGYIHHRLFKKYSRRTFWSHAHIWLGRIIITIGIINGGLGLELADNTHSGKIAYAVIAAIVWLVYLASIIIGERKRSRNAPPSYNKSLQMGQMGNNGNNGHGGSPSRHSEWYGKRT